jgi:hypothetical protein
MADGSRVHRAHTAKVWADAIFIHNGAPFDPQAQRADREPAPRGDRHTPSSVTALLISELEARIRRVEKHLNLPSL